MSMNKEALRMWLEGLRFGKFKKTKSELHNNEGQFCATGVLCEVYKRKTGIGEWIHNGDQFRVPTEVATSFPPNETIRWLFGKSNYMTEEFLWDIIHLNDVEKEDGSDFDFAEIADRIEASIYESTNEPNPSNTETNSIRD